MADSVNVAECAGISVAVTAIITALLTTIIFVLIQFIIYKYRLMLKEQPEAQVARKEPVYDEILAQKEEDVTKTSATQNPSYNLVHFA